MNKKSREMLESKKHFLVCQDERRAVVTKTTIASSIIVSKPGENNESHFSTAKNQKASTNWLYEEAKRREAVQKINRAKVSMNSSSIKPLSSSDKLLKKKFETEFNEYLAQLGVSSDGDLSQEELEHLMVNTGFIFYHSTQIALNRDHKDKQEIYRILKTPEAEHVSAKNLKTFLNAILGFSTSQMIDPCLQVNQGDFGAFDDKNWFKFADKEGIELVTKHFQRMARCRRQFVEAII